MKERQIKCVFAHVDNDTHISSLSVLQLTQTLFGREETPLRHQRLGIASSAPHAQTEHHIGHSQAH
jgi:hypothetical protein